ncbi:hypothetical protein JXB02_03800 [Candidatus Woesearchaeota archaeon]|nr:hypothetical protein [Candidatus Woesearchaeota archaeon]
MGRKKRFIIGIGLFLLFLPQLYAQIDPSATEVTICPDDWSESLAVSHCVNTYPIDYDLAATDLDYGCQTGQTRRYVYGPGAELACDELGVTLCCEVGERRIPAGTDACVNGYDEDSDGSVDCDDNDCEVVSVCSMSEPTFTGSSRIIPMYEDAVLNFEADVTGTTMSPSESITIQLLVSGASFDVRTCTSTACGIHEMDVYGSMADGSTGSVFSLRAGVPRSYFTAQRYYYGFRILRQGTIINHIQATYTDLTGCYNRTTNAWYRPNYPQQTRTCGSSIGICTVGTQYCTGYEVWSTCTGTLPGTETCGDGIDQDCSGADLACPPPPTACTDECDVLGQTFCYSNNLYTCITGSDGCYDRSIVESCANGCADSACIPATDCQHECGTTGTLSCSASGDLYICRADAAGCRSWELSQDCTGPCINTTVPPYCVDCANPCATEGAFECLTATSSRSCTRSLTIDSCLQWVPDTCDTCYESSTDPSVSRCYDECPASGTCSEERVCRDADGTEYPMQRIAGILCCLEGACQDEDSAAACTEPSEGTAVHQGLPYPPRCDGDYRVTFSCADDGSLVTTTATTPCEYGCVGGTCQLAPPTVTLTDAQKLRRIVEDLPAQGRWRENDYIDLIDYIRRRNQGLDLAALQVAILSTSTGTLTEIGMGGVWQTGFDSAGTYDTTLRLRMGNVTNQTSFRIIVEDINRAPKLEMDDTLSPYVGREGERLTIPFVASDPDGDPLSFDFTPTVQPGRENDPKPAFQIVGSSIVWDDPWPTKLYVEFRASDGMVSTQPEVFEIEIRPRSALADITLGEGEDDRLVRQGADEGFEEAAGEAGLSDQQRRELMGNPDGRAQLVDTINQRREEDARRVIDLVVAKDPSINKKVQLERFKETRPNIRITKEPTVDRERKETTVTIRLEPKRVMYNVTILEDIPKEVAESADELVFSVQPIVIEADPLIMWQFERLEAPVELSYTVKKELETVNTSTVPIAELVTLEEVSQPQVLWRLAIIPVVGIILIFFARFQHHGGSITKAEKAIEKESKEIANYLEKLADYVALELERGSPDMEIRTQLTVMGHRMDMIDQAFRKARGRVRPK